MPSNTIGIIQNRQLGSFDYDVPNLPTQPTQNSVTRFAPNPSYQVIHLSPSCSHILCSTTTSPATVAPLTHTAPRHFRSEPTVDSFHLHELSYGSSICLIPPPSLLPPSQQPPTSSSSSSSSSPLTSGLALIKNEHSRLIPHHSYAPCLTHSDPLVHLVSPTTCFPNSAFPTPPIHSCPPSQPPPPLPSTTLPVPNPHSLPFATDSHNDFFAYSCCCSQLNQSSNTVATPVRTTSYNTPLLHSAVISPNISSHFVPTCGYPYPIQSVLHNFLTRPPTTHHAHESVTTTSSLACQPHEQHLGATITFDSATAIPNQNTNYYQTMLANEDPSETDSKDIQQQLQQQHSQSDQGIDPISEGLAPATSQSPPLSSSATATTTAATLTQTADEGKSTFIRSSSSDIALDNLEELLARTSINDIYLGPVQSKEGILVSLDPSVHKINNHLSLPYSSTSLAFSPPGILIVTELWSMFLNDRLSYCNHNIQRWPLVTLRQCLYDHGLNQLGSAYILRRRLQAFVRRTREAQSIDPRRSIKDDDPFEAPSSPTLAPPPSTAADQPVNSQLETKPTMPNSNMTKLAKPVILTPDTFYSYLLIIDLEATCEMSDQDRANLSDFPHEIIEFPVLLYDTRSSRCVGVFHAYCKPKLKPDLSAFCTSLTQISQSQVDQAQPFPIVLARLEKWLLKTHNLGNYRCAVVCDCSSDMAKFMRIQCQLNDLPIPSWAKIWINLKKTFRTFYKLPARHRVNLSTMLKDLNLPFVGQRHRGLDDAINILRIVRILLADGCLLRVNECLDFGRPPTYFGSVPRHVAESTSGPMGSRLVLLTPRKPRQLIAQAEEEAYLNREISDTHQEFLLKLDNIRKSRMNNE